VRIRRDYEQGPWRRPTLTLIDRAIRAAEKNGLSVSQLKIEPDGTIIVGTQSAGNANTAPDDEWKVA
jgi:hypothetical protein